MCAKLRQTYTQENNDESLMNSNPNNPFKSEKQRRYMYAKLPKLAKRWTKKDGRKIG